MSTSRTPVRPTRSKQILRAAIAAVPALAGALLAAHPAAGATTLYWDINGATPDGSSTTTAAGTWNATNSNWSTDLTGSIATGVWTPGAIADFSAGTSVTGSYTVTVSGTQSIGGITLEEGTVNLSSGTLSLSGPTVIDTTSHNLTISGVITGTGPITRAMTGSTAAGVTLTLSGNNNFTGTFTTAATGAIILASNNALGASGASNGTTIAAPTTAGSGTMVINNGLVIPETITLTGDPTGRTGNGQLSTAANAVATWTGNIISAGTSNSLPGTGNFGGIATFGAASGSTFYISGAITTPTSGITFMNKEGKGTVVLQHDNSSVTTGIFGSLRLTEGQTIVETNGALGRASTGVGDNSHIVFIASQAVTGGVTSPRLAFRSTTGLNYTVNRYLSISAPAGFGGFQDTSFNSQKATIDNLGGNNTFAGDLYFTGAQPGGTGTTVFNSLGVTSGSLELSGQIWRTSNTTAPLLPPGDDPFKIYKIGSGELIVSGIGEAVNGTIPPTNITLPQYSFTNGMMEVMEGTLTLRGSTANPTTGGVLPLNGGIQVDAGATLKLDNTVGVNASRLPASAPVSLVGSGAEFQLKGNATTPVVQSLGTLSIASFATVTVQGVGAATELQLPGTSRSNRGTVLFRGMDNSLTKIRLNSSTTLGGGGGPGSKTISILPEAIGDTNSTGGGTDFVTVDSNYVRALSDANNEYQELSNDDGMTTLDNAKVTSNTAIASTTNTQVNSLKMSSGTTLTIGSGHRLTVNSGGVLAVGASPSTITGGNLAFEQYNPPGVYNAGNPFNSSAGAYASDIFAGPAAGVTDGAVDGGANEGIITVPTGATLIQDASNVISGAQGLTKSGGGTLRLLGTNTFGALKDYWYYDGAGFEYEVTPGTPAPLTINAGRLEFNTDANLGYSASPIFINGGILAPLQTSSSSRAITLASLGTNTIDVGGSATYTVAGLVSGNALTKNGAGILTLTNTSNNYTGGTIINAGYIELLTTNPTQADLGSGVTTLNGGSLRADDDLVLDRSIVSTSTNSTGGFYIAPGKTLTYGSAPTSAVGMSGSGNIAINGGGTLLLSHNTGTQMTYTGSLIVNDGSTLDFEDNGAGNTQSGLGGTPSNSATWVVLNDNSRLKFGVTSSAGTDFSSSTRGITVNSTGGIIDIAGANTVLNNGGIHGSGTITKDGTGLYSLRVSNASFTGKWNVLQGTLEFGASTNNALSLGTGSGADFITIQNGATLRQTTTSASGTMAANQGITLAGAVSTIDVATGTSLSVPGDITAGTGKTLNKIGTGSLSIKNYRGDTLNVNAGNVKILADGTSAATSKINTVTVAASSTLDLTNNKLVLTGMPAGSSAFPYTGVTALVKTGQGTMGVNGPNWNGTGGISTSDAGAVNSIAKTLAVMTATDAKHITGAQTALFGGQTVSPTDTLVMYTWGGDTDLSGKIDADDYFQIDSNYNKSGTAFGYHDGDFNYDGQINGDDYFIIDSNYLASQANPISPGSALDSGSALMSGVVAVPEPAGLTALILAAGLLRRRRKC